MINLNNLKQEINSTTKNIHINKNLTKIIEIREMILKRSLEKVTFSSPIILKNNVGIIYPNTINVIQGRKGAHKSRLTELICILMIDIHKNELLGLHRQLAQKTVVIYVDTERNQKDQFPAAMQKIRTKSGFPSDQNPDILDFISLIDISRADRFEALKSYLKQQRLKMPNEHFFIILDVVTDCVENFNDPKESLKLIDMINEMINQEDVTFLCVIHENPGSEKTRGHTGSELNFKASQVMQIGFVKDSKDIISLKFLHSRNTKPLDDIILTYSETEGGLIEADGDMKKDASFAGQAKAKIPEVKEWLKKLLTHKKSKTTLIKELKVKLSCGDRILEDRLKTLCEDGFLIVTKNGNTKVYELAENCSRISQPPIYANASCEDLFSNKNDHPNN